ncbi:MAG: hypothetical protein HQL93_02295, partial [Magnetococcales bacterium]|nr:hypothetical protein [Magnetococcales bacterium]
MYWNVVEAKVLDHLEFAVTFADGLSGQVRLLPSHLYGVFEVLKKNAKARQNKRKHDEDEDDSDGEE